MTRSVRIHEFGSAEVLKIEDVVADAHRFIEAGEQTGKIVVTA
jgi:hypothetical protein